MDKERNEITEILLNAALEIIYLLTGEDYTVVKKTTGVSVTPIIHFQESKGWSRTPGPTTEPLPHPLTSKKILELTKKMMELLTGEVPIRCRDITVDNLTPAWKNIGGHQELYNDVLMENHQPLTSPDGPSRRNPQKRRPCPLYFQDCPEEDPNVPDKQQDENLIGIKIEVIDEDEMDIEAEHPYGSEERNPPERRPRLYPQDCPEEDPNVPENQQDESLINIKVEVKDEAEETDIRAGYQYGSNERNSRERHPPLLYSQDSPEEDPNVPESHQEEDLIDIKGEVEEEKTVGDHLCNSEVEGEERMMGNNSCKSEVEEEMPVDIATENCSKENVIVFVHEIEDDEDIPHLSSGESLTTLDVHPELHSPDLSYNPPNQEEPFPEQSRMVTTITGVKGGGKQFTKSSRLLSHNPEEKPFSCSRCGKCFTDESNLVKHERIHTGKKQYSCSECGRCFITKARLGDHQSIHTGAKPFSCSECEKCFITKARLRDHERIHTGEKPFSCSKCGMCFTNLSSRLRHERIHTGEKPYSCSECGKCFARKANLGRHERVHTGEKPYSCSECGKCFTTETGFRDHERIHRGEKPFSCSECEKCFITKARLRDHQRFHTGEKPFPCPECGMCFTDKSSLLRHERIHTGEKPYSCSECGKCFINKSDLAKHTRVHTGEKPYSCPDCGKCFTDKSAVVRHKRIHTGEKPYSCPECGKCFTDLSTLVKHERSHTIAKLYVCSQ